MTFDPSKLSFEEYREYLRGIVEPLEKAAGTYKSPALSRPAAEPFGSRNDLTDAMRDPRYQKDSNYRREVAERLAASPSIRQRR